MRMCVSVCVGRTQSRAGESQAATAAAINAWPARLNSNFACLSAHLIQYSWWVPSLCCCRCRYCCCWHRVIAPWGALWERKKYKLLLYPHFSVTRRDATQRRRRRRRQGRQRWLWQRRSLSKNSSRNRSVCVNMCCVCVCASRRLILVAKVIYFLVTRSGTWRGTRWPKLSQMANSWQFDNKAETASSCCCCNLAQVTRGNSEKEGREREGEGDTKRKTIQSLHWFALKCIYSSLLAFFLLCCCCCCCRCLWQLNVKFCPLAYVTKNGAQNGCQEHPLAKREKHT